MERIIRLCHIFPERQRNFKINQICVTSILILLISILSILYVNRTLNAIPGITGKKVVENIQSSKLQMKVHSRCNIETRPFLLHFDYIDNVGISFQSPKCNFLIIYSFLCRKYTTLKNCNVNCKCYKIII